MLEKVTKAISMYGMVTNGDSIYVGLSGGADSVSLLVALNELKEHYGISLQAIHINHQLRGEESLRDENFCISLCERLSIPLQVERIDVKGYCKEHKVSTEEGARILRYEVFKKLSNGKIATAHTLSDNCETMLYNLTRGAGTKGLMGIPPTRDNIIRPLILCTRQEVEEFLKVRGFSFVVDSTNLSDDYTRNKIRHNVIPTLKGINPQFESKVFDTISILSEDNSYIDGIANKLYEDNISKDGKTLNVDLRKYHNAIKHRCIAKLFKDNALTYSHERILLIAQNIERDGKVNVTRDVYCVSKSGIVSIMDIPSKCTTPTDMFIELKINGITNFGNKVIETKLLEKIGFIHKKLTYYILDYDKIQGETHLRGRVFGDKIQLKGRGFTSSVKKLINENIPKDCRENLCFIQDDLGLIFMERLGVAQRVSCDKNTKRYLTIKIVENNQN
jgi:tRNA(Ile)-lysidine synthase